MQNAEYRVYGLGVEGEGNLAREAPRLLPDVSPNGAQPSQNENEKGRFYLSKSLYNHTFSILILGSENEIMVILIL